MTTAYGNKIIGKFMGKNFKNPLNYLYDKSWDWLIPAIKKFDRLNDLSFEYENLCDEIDNAVTLYEIKPAYEKLVKAIEWFNQDTYIKQ